MENLENEEQETQNTNTNEENLEEKETNQEIQKDDSQKENVGAENIQPEKIDSPEKTDTIIEGNEENQTKEKKKYSISLKKVFYILIALIIIALAIIISLWGSQISIYFNQKTNKYGFDYNFSKVKSHDWDSVLTEQKISGALNIPLQKINTQKNPDYSWVLESPDELVNSVICASILEEKILYEENETKNNLFNVSIMVCKDTKKSEELFTTREGNLQLLTAQDNSIKIKSHNQTQNIGVKAYDYLLEKKVSAEEGGGQESTSNFSGLVFLRGPFLVRIEESESGDFTVLSENNLRLKLAQQIDQELRSTLSLF